MSKLNYKFYENLAGLPHVTCPCLFASAFFSEAVHGARKIGPVTWDKCRVIPGPLTPATPRRVCADL